MKHPEVFLVPAMMLADYYLTLWGATLSDGGYRDHFKSASYELNPIWRGDIGKLRRFNPRHLLLTAIATGLLIWAGESDVLFSDWFFPVMFGMVLGAFVPILAQHLGNVFLFDFMRRHPNEVEGVVTFSMRYAVISAIAQGFTVLALLVVIAVLTREPVVVGMLVGASVLMVARFNWLKAR
jgi:hypothetical protein